MAEVHATDFGPVLVLREGQVGRREQERPRGRNLRASDGEPLQLSTTQPYMPNYLISPDSAGFPSGFHTSDWLTGTSYHAYETTQNQWSHDGVPHLETSSPYEDISHSLRDTYTRSETYHAAAGYYSPPLENTDSLSQIQSVNQLVANYPTYYSQPTHIDHTHSPHNQVPLQAASVSSYDALSPYETNFSSDFHPNRTPVWSTQFPQDQPLEYDTCVNLSPVAPFSTSQLQWPAESQITPQSLGLVTGSVVPPKRKRASPDPAPPKRSRTNDLQNLSEFVVVFENAPGALSAVKHRRKLDAPVRKAARDVRKAGACHQCRFRKRTCSTGTPCISCLKNGNGLHEVKCQRESPFVGKLMHQYFEFSSTKRNVCFEVNIPLDLIDDSNREILTIDGIGRVSHTIKIYAGRRLLKGLNRLEQDAILQTSNFEPATIPKDDVEVVLLGDDKKLGQQIEQWAVEYTSKFVHAAGPAFYSTTMAQILGTAYVKKELPECKLVATMLRVASLAFVLRAGIKFSSSTTSDVKSNFRTVQARVDTILYGRLQIAEMELFQMLQRLIFRTAGCLTREQIFPVALVLWQLLRIVSLSSSHLSNIAKKFRSKAYGQADYQFVSLRLLLSTHMALFRSSNPLLLVMDEKNNRDLVGGDDELIGLCLKMRNVVLTFRDKGFPEMKGSIAYKKEYFDMFRKVYITSRS